MSQRAIWGVVYGSLLLLFLIGTNLLFLEQIINTENLSETTVQISRIIGIAAVALTAGLWFARRPFQRVVTWYLDDAVQAWSELRQHTLKTMRQENGWYLAVLGSIVILGIGLRLLFITQPIRTDEALTYLQFASKPLYLALSDYAAPNNHLLHTFCVHLSTRLFGNSEVAIRLPAFVFGILVIPAAYSAIRTVYNKQAALLAAGLCAVSSVLIEYSVNARGYTLQTTLFLVALTLATYLRQHPRPAVWSLLALLLAAGFYTVPTMLYGATSIMLWLLVSIAIENTGTSRRKLLFYWLGTGMMTGFFTLCLYLPVLIVSGVSAITSNIYVQALDLSQFIAQTPPALALLWQHWHTNLPPIVSLFLALGAVVALIRHRHIGRQPIALGGVAVVVIPAILLVQRVHPFERVWLFLLPLYLGMAAAGLFYCGAWLDSFAKKRFRNETVLGRYASILGRIMAVFLIAIGAMSVLQTQSPYYSTETGTFRDAETVALFFAEQHDAEKIIYEHPSGESLRYYFLRHQIPLTRLEWDYVPYEKIYVVVNTEYAQDIASVLRQNGLRVADYDVTLVQAYPLAAIFIAHLKGVKN